MENINPYYSMNHTDEDDTLCDEMCEECGIYLEGDEKLLCSDCEGKENL